MSEGNPLNTTIEVSRDRKMGRAQGNALIGGAFVVMSMGFYMAWSIYFFVVPNQWAYPGMSIDEVVHAMVSWHIAFVIGAAAGVLLVQKFPKSIIYYGTSAGVILSAILMLPSWDDLIPIIIARYIGGLAHGAVFLTIIIHASEVAEPKFRGGALAAISFYVATSLFLGYMLIGLMGYLDSSSFYADQLLACLTIVYGVIALITTRLLCIESPIYLLQHNENAAALTTLAKLRNDSVDSWSDNKEFTEMQALVTEERSESISLFAQSNLKPLMRAAFLRALYGAATIVALNTYAYVFLAIDLRQFGLGVAYTARFIAESVAIYFVDRKGGRRLMVSVSLALAGLMLAIIGGLLLSTTINYSVLTGCGVLFIFFSLCYGFGLAPVSLIYMGESFTLKKKPYSILCVLTAEQLVHFIIFLVIRYSTIYPDALFLSLGLFMIPSAALVYLITRETKGLTLKEARDALR